LGVPIMAFWGLAQPSISSLMSQEVGPDSQGKMQGANAGMLGLSGLVGPWIFALTFAFAIDPSKGLMIPGMPFYLAAAVMLIALVVGVGVRRNAQPKKLM
jgi:MFS transporter, DHA1 family, tetracycline resistance protein